MITVYLEGFAQKTLRPVKADISVVGQREILTIRDYADNAIAQFDMNTVEDILDKYRAEGSDKE